MASSAGLGLRIFFEELSIVGLLVTSPSSSSLSAHHFCLSLIWEHVAEAHAGRRLDGLEWKAQNMAYLSSQWGLLRSAKIWSINPLNPLTVRRL